MTIFQPVEASSWVNIQNNGCEIKIGGWSYNITPLASSVNNNNNTTTGNDVTCVDLAYNTYYYHPCSVVQRACDQTETILPAICQKDSRANPLYHNLGTLDHISVRERTAGPGTGFVLTFEGGEEGRSTDLEFVCNATVGIGVLEAVKPSEDPKHHYHLQWKTAFACPTDGPPSSVLYLQRHCCFYADDGDDGHGGKKEDTRVSCMTKDENCPMQLGELIFVNEWSVLDCGDCFFNPSNANELQSAQLVEHQQQEDSWSSQEKWAAAVKNIRKASLNKPSSTWILLNSFVLKLKEGSNPDDVAKALGCRYAGAIAYQYHEIRCGPNQDSRKPVVSPAIVLPTHDAVISSYQTEVPDPKVHPEAHLRAYD